MTKILGICGPSGSGKTTLALRLGELFDATLISTDGYFFLDPPVKKYGENGKDWELPENIDWNALKACLLSLKTGSKTQGRIIRWDTNTYEEFELLSKPVVIIEGLHLLYDPEFIKLLDLSVYINVSDEVGLERRIAREGHDENRRWFEEVTFPEYADRRKLYEGRADVVLDGSLAIEQNMTLIKEEMFKKGIVP